MEAESPEAAGLLAGPHTPLEDRRPRSRVARVLSIVVATVFVAYHGLALLAWNLPHKHAGKTFYQQYAKWTQVARYFRGTGNVQSWAMFAPNPNRTNAFVRVLVIDDKDEVWDMDQDIYGKNRYPYLWYDRMGKINRRIDGKKGYQKAYGAYICREWERAHGVLPKEVRFVRRSSRIPSPWDASVRPGPLGLRYEPWDLPTRQSEQERIRCKAVNHGQLSPALRARAGMDPAPEGHFKPVKHSTWWTKAERKREAEARKVAREARQATAKSPTSETTEAASATERAPTIPRHGGAAGLRAFQRAGATRKSVDSARGEAKGPPEPAASATPASGQAVE